MEAYSSDEERGSLAAAELALADGLSRRFPGQAGSAIAIGAPGVEQLHHGGEADSVAEVRRRERIFRRAMALSDAAAAAFAVVLAIDLVDHYALRPGFLLFLPVVVLAAKVQGLYDHDDLVIRKSTLDEVPRLVNLATLTTLLVWLSHHYIVIGAPHSTVLLKLWVALLAFIMLGRIAARAIAARTAPRERCFFIGGQPTAERLRAKLAHGSNVDLVGMIVDDEVGLDEQQLKALTRRFDIHRIIIGSAAGVAEEKTIDLVRAAKTIGLRVTISPGMMGVVGSSLVLDDVWGLPLLGLPRFGLTRSSAVLKRAFDLIGASAALVVSFPLFVLAGLLIKLDSPGPILFRQLRVGRDGELFEMLKLRTMVADAEERKADLRDLNEADGIFKIGADPRMTRVGRWLRRISFDEAPQLINVLRGQMSLVGPRPLVLDEDETITGFDRRRLTITPGMTGPWQILGSARIPLEEMIKLDYMYVANWSLWSDMKILVRTIGVVLRGQGL
jgi:exopolysaccharide biosynthesis polyprenyl glycosylphosphotransferase